MSAQKRNTLYLTFICLVSALGGFLFGYDTAVISGTISFVKTQFMMNVAMEGWFVGSALLGCIIGVAFAGILSDTFGRKNILFISALLFTISAIGCMVMQEQYLLIIFRLIGGMGVGIASMVSPLYISEISPPELRGRLVTLYQFAITIGILCAYFVNAFILSIPQNFSLPDQGFFHLIFVQDVWRAMFGSETIPALLFFFLLFFVPRSPRWLITKGHPEKAQAILTRIAGNEAAEQEMKGIRKAMARETGSFRQLLQPGLRLALFIGITLAILSQLTGINAIIYYGPRIFESAGFGIGHSLNSQVIIGIINVLFTLIAIWKIDKLGRKPLLITGSSGMMLFLVMIGFLFQTGNESSIGLLILILCYIAFFAFSFGPVIWTLLSEIYPTHIRGRAMSIATLSLWVGTYIIGQSVPWLLENLSPQGTFWLFALMCIPAILITWKLVPETKGKTLEQIEMFWLSKKTS